MISFVLHGLCCSIMLADLELSSYFFVTLQASSCLYHDIPNIFRSTDKSSQIREQTFLS